MQIIFHKGASKYRSLLRKMTYKDKGSYESSPPCSNTSLHVHVHTAYTAYIYRIHVHIAHIGYMCMYAVNACVNTCISDVCFCS